MRYYNRFKWDMDYLPGILIWGAMWVLIPVLLFLTIKGLREKISKEVNESYGMDDTCQNGYIAFEFQTNLIICYNLFMASGAMKTPNAGIGILMYSGLITAIMAGITSFIRSLITGNETLGHFLAVAVCWLKALAVAASISMVLSSVKGRSILDCIPITTYFYNAITLLCIASFFCKVIAERPLRLHAAAVLIWSGVIFPFLYQQDMRLANAFFLGAATALLPAFAGSLWLNKYREHMEEFIAGAYDDRRRKIFCMIFCVYGGVPLALHILPHTMMPWRTSLQTVISLVFMTAGQSLLVFTFAVGMVRYILYATGRYYRQRKLARVLGSPFFTVAPREFTLNDDDEIHKVSSRLIQRLIQGNEVSTAAHIYELLSPSSPQAALNQFLLNRMLTENAGNPEFSRQLQKRLVNDNYHLFFEPFLDNPPENQHRKRIHYLFFDGDPTGLVMPRKRDSMVEWFRKMNTFRNDISEGYAGVMERFLGISSYKHMPLPHVIIPTDRIVRMFRQGFFNDNPETLFQDCMSAPIHREKRGEILLQAFFCLPFHEKTAEYLLSMDMPAHEHIARDWFFHSIQEPGVYTPSNHDEVERIMNFLFKKGLAPANFSIQTEPLIQVLDQHPSCFWMDAMGRLMENGTALDADVVMQHKSLTPSSAEKLLQLAANTSWGGKLIRQIKNTLTEPIIFQHLTFRYNSGLSAAATWNLALIQWQHQPSGHVP